MCQCVLRGAEDGLAGTNWLSRVEIAGFRESLAVARRLRRPWEICESGYEICDGGDELWPWLERRPQIQRADQPVQVTEIDIQ